MIRQRILGAVLVGAIVLVSVGPVVWLGLTSLKSRKTIIESPPRLVFTPTFDNFSGEYYGEELSRLLFNAGIIAVSSAVAACALGIPAGFFFARVRTRLSEHLFLFVLSTRVLSPIVLSLPYVALFSFFSLRGSYLGIVMCHIAFNVSLIVWVAERYFVRLDPSIEVAALVDGASDVRLFAHVVLPQSVPLIGVCLLLSVVFSWNEFMIASVMSAGETRPITTALPAFVTQGVTQWGRFSVAAFASMVPVFFSIVLLLRAAARVSPAFLLSTKG